MSEFWTETTDENMAKDKIITNSSKSEKEFTRDNKEDLFIIKKYLKIKSHDKVLDFGCGIGRLMKPLSNSIPNIHGYDISPLHLKMGSKYCPKGKFISEVPLDFKYDKIYSTLVFQHMEKHTTLSTIVNLKNMLNENGKIILQFPNLLEQNKKWFINYINLELTGQVNKKDSCYPLMRFYTKEELKYYGEIIDFKYMKIITEKRKNRLWLYGEK